MVTAHHNQLIRFSTRSDHDLLEQQEPVNLVITVGNPITRLLHAIIKKLFVITVRRKGHIAKICRSKLPMKSAHTSGKQPAKPSHFVDHDIDEQEQPSEYNPMFAVNTCNNTNELNNFFTVTMTINGNSVGMQIDTGAAVSVMSVVTYEQLWPQGNGPTLKPTNTKGMF